MAEHDRYRDEIVGLHEFFVGWFTGTLQRDAFDRIEDALAPEFAMVSPTGDRAERDRVIAMVADGYAGREPGAFTIEIRNVEVVHTAADCTVVSYEEWQHGADGETGRLSTAIFREDLDAPEGVAWVYLHETWLEDGTD